MLENNSNLSELDKANFESHTDSYAPYTQGSLMFSHPNPFLCPQVCSM